MGICLILTSEKKNFNCSSNCGTKRNCSSNWKGGEYYQMPGPIIPQLVKEPNPADGIISMCPCSLSLSQTSSSPNYLFIFLGHSKLGYSWDVIEKIWQNF